MPPEKPSPPPTAAKPPEPVKPAPAQIDYRLEWVKMLAQEIYKLQRYYDASVQPPEDWETVWVAESAKLVELTEGKDRYFDRSYMLEDMIILSQAKYPTKYTSPASIGQHIPELAEEVLALRTSDEFDTIWDIYLKASGRLTKNDDELDSEAFERRAKDKQKSAELALKAWNRWMAKHRQQNQPESSVA
jgi:hypothetical protein